MIRAQGFYFCLSWILYNLSYIHGSYKFNSLKCDILAPEMGYVKQCLIKAIDRKHNMINIEAILNKTITEFEIHFRMVKREIGGWHPFLYDMRMDICQFFKNRRKFFIPNLIYSFLKPFTNVNHTCPYLVGTEMRLWHWSPDEDGVIAKFPVDHGQYGLQTTWYINKVTTLKINGSVLFFK
ncbi:uncharacterized protein LOC128256104 [Drosophila gunungcola]|uniref:Uncharacterized protein n=1 Tax=Drosophila gunungcola TaxID=103775 RepID=A0A9Q0BV10_9MUSC|nr:uncharacterized protein LOC128256104 [Drosophila gunungcola]KAI8045592.1 hypothetical protein M5D96_001774 [Drosophila gunungcola]